MRENIAALLRDAGFDCEGAIRRFGNNEALFNKFFLRFPEEKTVEQCKQAFAAGDTDAAYLAAHTLKGVSANLGINTVTAACVAVLEPMKVKDMQTAINNVPAMEAAFNRACAVIRSLESFIR